jgi:pimeloyl-ACP methyl ester carboxylesterase
MGKVMRTRILLAAALSAGTLLGLASSSMAAGNSSATAASSDSGTSKLSLGLGPVQHVSANGLSIGYRTGGHGPWLIMVMGRSGTMAEWDPQLIRQLIRNHRVLIFDNRGMGTTNSSVPASEVTVPLMAQDTLALADALYIERFDLMGWSMGGEIAQQVTVDAPERVIRLVLCATGSGGPTEQLPSAPIQKIMSAPDLPTWTLFGLSFPPTAAGIKGAFDYAARVAAQAKYAHLPSDSFTESQSGMEGQQHAREQWTSSEGGVYDDLPQLKTRTLVMWGNLDAIDPPANDKLLVKQLKHATYKVFKGAGHAFLFQDAREVGKTADAFLR